MENKIFNLKVRNVGWITEIPDSGKSTMAKELANYLLMCKKNKKSNIMDNNKANKNLTIYTTGAFLKQRKIKVDSKDYGFWIVEEFTDESFLDWETCNQKNC